MPLLGKSLCGRDDPNSRMIKGNGLQDRAVLVDSLKFQPELVAALLQQLSDPLFQHHEHYLDQQHHKYSEVTRWCSGPSRKNGSRFAACLAAAFSLD